MTSIGDVLKRDFNVDQARLSPEFLAVLERLDRLVAEADQFALYMEPSVAHPTPLSLVDDRKRPEPELIDKTKGKLVEEPERKAPTPAEKQVKDADEDLQGDKPEEKSKL